MKINKFKKLVLSLSKGLIFSFLLVGLLTSCKQKQNETPNSENFEDAEILKENKVISSGIEYSIVVVSDLAAKYPDLKYALINLFKIEFPVLPQSEAYFHPIIIHPDSLTSNQKLNLSILVLNLNSHDTKMSDFAQKEFNITAKSESPGYKIIENHWAYPQKIIYIEASSIEELIKLMEQQQDNFITIFDKCEKIRLKRKVYANGRNNTATNHLLKMHKIDFSIPKGYVKIREKIPSKSDTTLKRLAIDGLSWFRSSTKAYSMDLMFYYTPLKDYQDADAEKLMKKKDQMTKQLIQGENAGSYVVIAHNYNPPVFKKITIAGMEAMEIRGLWETEGDFMGGPFVFYAIEDKKNNRMLFIDAFVYAPELDKKQFIKRIEVTLETLR